MNLSVNGLDYHVRMSGQGDPLVLLHGFAGSGANWSPEMFPDHLVITPDLLGHGMTESPDELVRYTRDWAADDLVALVRRLADPPVNLLGYSMGGRLALFTALKHPDFVKKLVLESASPGIANDDERMTRYVSDMQLALRIEREGVSRFIGYWENLPLFGTQTPDQRDRLRPVRLANNPYGIANSLRWMGTGFAPSLWNRLGDLKIPVLLIAGALDVKFTAIARQMHERIPNATLAIIPDAGHTVHLEKPDAYTQVVQRFLTF